MTHLIKLKKAKQWNNADHRRAACPVVLRNKKNRKIYYLPRYDHFLTDGKICKCTDKEYSHACRFCCRWVKHLPFSTAAEDDPEDATDSLKVALDRGVASPELYAALKTDDHFYDEPEEKWYRPVFDRYYWYEDFIAYFGQPRHKTYAEIHKLLDAAGKPLAFFKPSIAKRSVGFLHQIPSRVIFKSAVKDKGCQVYAHSQSSANPPQNPVKVTVTTAAPALPPPPAPSVPSAAEEVPPPPLSSTSPDVIVHCPPGHLYGSWEPRGSRSMPNHWPKVFQQYLSSGGESRIKRKEIDITLAEYYLGFPLFSLENNELQPPGFDQLTQLFAGSPILPPNVLHLPGEVHYLPASGLCALPQLPPGLPVHACGFDQRPRGISQHPHGLHQPSGLHVGPHQQPLFGFNQQSSQQHLQQLYGHNQHPYGHHQQPHQQPHGHHQQPHQQPHGHLHGHHQQPHGHLHGHHQQPHGHLHGHHQQPHGHLHGHHQLPQEFSPHPQEFLQHPQGHHLPPSEQFQQQHDQDLLSDAPSLPTAGQGEGFDEESVARWISECRNHAVDGSHEANDDQSEHLHRDEHLSAEARNHHQAKAVDENELCPVKQELQGEGENIEFHETVVKNEEALTVELSDGKEGAECNAQLNAALCENAKPPGIGSHPPCPDGNNGDQFFNATFNGIPSFSNFAQRGRGDGGIRPKGEHYYPPPPPAQGPGMEDPGGLGEKFSTAVSLGKGRNIGAKEFVPKTNGTTSLSHSASSPAFATYAQTLSGMAATAAAPAPAVPAAAAAHLATNGLGRSPLASPHCSPASSPMLPSRQPAAELSPGQMVPSNAPTTNGAADNDLMLENVGGTTYFYSQEDFNSHGGMVFPNFTVYPGMLPHIAHMKPKSNQPSFFMPDEMKMELLNRQSLSLLQMDAEHLPPDLPREVDDFHNLVPLEPPTMSPLQQKSSTFGYQTSAYKAISTKDGFVYCLRRIHGFRLSSTKCMALIDLWKKMQHANIVQLRQVFTTKAFNDHSMVFVYDYHPAAENVMSRHFSSNQQAHNVNGYNNPYNLDGQARPFSAGKGRGTQQGLLPESLIWAYVVQLSSALRTIHAHGLACRVIDPTKVLLTDKSRVRINCVGIFDVLSFDASQANPLAMMPHYQQEDLVSLGKTILALACNSIIGIQKEHMQTSLDVVARNYSPDLKNLLFYLLTNHSRNRSVNDIMPMIGARFYSQLDAAQLKNDVMEAELNKEVENGRLYRMMCKLGTINERPEYNLDETWSETGDRYMLKLFRDYIFHQVDDRGSPYIDMGHVTQCLNKLDAGVPEKICLMSRDEQSVILVSYAELKHCVESSFSELLQSSPASGAVSGLHPFS